MSGEADAVPDWQLERFRLHELPSEEQRAVAEAAERTEAVRARLAELDRSDREIRALHPPARMAEDVTVRARPARAPRPTSSLRPLLAVAVTAGALVMALARLIPSPDGPTASVGPPDETRIKGPKPALVLYRQSASEAERLPDGAVVHERDVVQVFYLASGSRYGVVLSIDGRGEVTVHHPVGDTRAPKLTPGRPTPLSSAYELDDAPVFERFYLVTAEAPFDIVPVGEAARRLGSGAAEGRLLDLPPDFSQSTFLLRKDGSR